MIEVGVDAWNLPGDRRGIGRYLRRLLAEFDDTFGARIRCTLIVPEWATSWVAPRYRREVDGRRFRIRSRRAVDRSGLDLLWFPFNGCSWDRFSLPAVATLHDASTFVLPGFADYARAPFRCAARHCARVITDSVFSADELARVLPYARERIDVVHLGVGAPATGAPSVDLAALGRYVLFVGEAEPRKGVDVLAAAVAQLADGNRDIRLVVAGTFPPGTPIPPRTTALGFVDDATLAALYRGCAVFAYPSRYEGFGLPVLEAMHAGAPVVASDATAIPEAAGDAALLVRPGDPAALAAALARVLDDPATAAELRARGSRRAATMTWRRTAEATLAVFERVVAEARG